MDSKHNEIYDDTITELELQKAYKTFIIASYQFSPYIMRKHFNIVYSELYKENPEVWRNLLFQKTFLKIINNPVDDAVNIMFVILGICLVISFFCSFSF